MVSHSDRVVAVESTVHTDLNLPQTAQFLDSYFLTHTRDNLNFLNSYSSLSSVYQINFRYTEQLQTVAELSVTHSDYMSFVISCALCL